MGAGYSGIETSTNTRYPLGYIPPNTSQVTNTAQVTEILTRDQFKSCFESCKESNKLLVIDFSATWCGPCKFIEPVLKQFAANYTDVEFIKIDVDKFEGLAREYQVEAMPTFIVIKGGKEVERIIGAKKDDLKMKIEKHRQQRESSNFF
ncbi:hypothetical protein ACFE04_025256 [Oxalis oulophora]